MIFKNLLSLKFYDLINFLFYNDEGLKYQIIPSALGLQYGICRYDKTLCLVCHNGDASVVIGFFL